MHLLAHITYGEVLFVVAIYVLGVGSGMFLATQRRSVQQEASRKDR